MKNINQTSFFFGLFLILFGSVYLMKNFGWIDVSISDAVHLWPLLLIAWGFSYIPMKENLRFVLNTLLLILFFGMWITIDHSGGIFSKKFIMTWNDQKLDIHTQDDEFDSEAKEFYFKSEKPDDVTEGEVVLSVPASSLEMEEKTDLLYELVAENIPYDLESKMSVTGNRARIEFKIPEGFTSTRLNTDSFMELKLNPDVVWEMKLKAGASDLDLELKDFKVKKLEISSGAAEMDIVLGDKYSETVLEFTSGASSVDLYVPQTAGVQVELTNVLGNSDLKGLKKIKKGLYQSENFNEADQKIYVNFQSAMSDFELERY